MRRVVIIVLFTIAGLVPLVRYHPGGSSPTTTAAHTSASQPTGPVTSTTSAPPTPGGPTPTPSPSATATKTVNGSTVDTEFGPYQVQVVFTGSKITDVQIITEPGDRHSQRIADAAAPTLRQEALQAQSAHVDTVSGATATSDAYAQSLQAAIDAKGN
jgi:uncharacterized protein with FMN-binding domain